MSLSSRVVLLAGMVDTKAADAAVPPVLPTAYNFSCSAAGMLPKDDGDAFVVPYWHVAKTGVKKAANMVCKAIDSKDDTYAMSVPVLVNSRRLNPFDELKIYDQAKADAEKRKKEQADEDKQQLAKRPKHI